MAKTTYMRAPNGDVFETTMPDYLAAILTGLLFSLPLLLDFILRG